MPVLSRLVDDSRSIRPFFFTHSFYSSKSKSGEPSILLPRPDHSQSRCRAEWARFYEG